ncbi:MAG: hypothetical protein RSD04_00845 [Clostridia bacterium]
MEDEFYGSIALQADEKGRFRVPSKFRTKFGDDSIFSFQNGSPCLSIISHKSADEISAKLRPHITLRESPESRVARVLLSQMCEIKEDVQGRFTLSTDIKEELGISKEVVFVGMGGKVEMWDKSRWEAEKKFVKNDPQLQSSEATKAIDSLSF